MIISILFVFCFQIIAQTTPRFKKVVCKWNDENGNKYDLCLAVDYQVDKVSDVALLSKVNNLNTVFWGKLLNETTNVAATIEDLSNPDDMEVRYFLWPREITFSPLIKMSLVVLK